ncbi:serine hydrolase [candidate division KSB1 bacterium]|nr:serine hydrolase [candidate division KSB1 bacterium]
MGIMAKNLRTGKVLAVAEKEKFPTASAIKLPILVEYFYQLSEDKISPQQTMVLDSTNKWGGSGLYQYFLGRSEQKMGDAVMMMMVVSDNTATNLVINALGETHAEKLAAVNNRMARLGLKNTRLLNKMMSWSTKTDSSESIRYGVGVSTAEDMVLLLEKLYRGELVDSTACQEMIDILEHQFYSDMIPRFLPGNVRVAHKTGSVTAVRVDVGLVLSPQTDFAIAIFCDQIRDYSGSPENKAVLAMAQASRLVWNIFTGEEGYERLLGFYVDWNPFPGGQWARIFLSSAPFPHPSRKEGWQYKDRRFPYDPHYIDSSAVVVIPDGFHQGNKGETDLIVHFHGWNNDNLGVLEKFQMPQQLIASRKNAILVLAQGPWRASDSGGGKMEDDCGFRRLVEEILSLLTADGRLKSPTIGRVIVTAHSGGYRPAIYAVARGGLMANIQEVYLFDAFYSLTEELIPWLKMDKEHKLRSIYTEHLAPEHQTFMELLRDDRLSYVDRHSNKAQIVLQPTTVRHNYVINRTFQLWLQGSCLNEIMSDKSEKK